MYKWPNHLASKDLGYPSTPENLNLLQFGSSLKKFVLFDSLGHKLFSTPMHSQAVFSSADPDFINALAQFQSLAADQKEAFCREKCTYVCQGSDKERLFNVHVKGVRHLNKLYLNYL